MLMGAVLTKQEIRSLCGATMYSRGESYFRSHRVERLGYDPDESTYSAVVRGTRKYNVSITIDEHTYDVEADCDCPAADSGYYCKHIAAAMLQIESLSRQSSGRTPAWTPRPALQAVPAKPAVPAAPAISEREAQLARNLIALFELPQAGLQRQRELEGTEAGQTVAIEFVCRISTGYRGGVYVELKIGPGKLYIVQKLKDFLDKLDKQIPYSFTKLFTFDPLVHRFNEPDEAAIGLLRDIYSNEQIYRELMSGYYSSSGGDRALFVPPAAWEPLRGKLADVASSRFEIDGRSYDRLDIREGSVPLRFELDSGPIPQSYSLRLSGLSDLKLLPKYGFAVSGGGGLYQMDAETLSLLATLQTRISQVPVDKVSIPPGQVDAFMRRVVPGLRKLGEFRVQPAIADRIVNEPLKTNVYLDRGDGRLIAKVEFVYGETRFSPLAAGGGRGGAGDLVVMRQPEREERVLSLLRQSAFRPHGEEYVLDAEEDVYAFLYGGLERLQREAEVYATPAVEAARANGALRPRATVDVDEGTDWLEVRFDIAGIEEAELIALLRSISEKKKYHRLTTGAFVSLEQESFREIGRLFEELGIRKSELKGGQVRLPVARGLSLQESGSGGPGVKLGKALRTLLDNLKNPDNLEFEPPAALAPILRDYQRYGFQWLRTIGHYGFGGILADDMGLGKTLQSIAYIASTREHGNADAPALIVCPASLVYNWRNELTKFAPWLTAAVAAGTKAERDAVLEDVSAVDVLITSYPLLRRDVEWYAAQRFHTLILDEAQAIKNSATQTAQAAKSLTAAHRFALTGTPVENRLEELWSIYDAVFPELFAGRKSFSDLTPEQVARKVRPFLLRRLKKDVLTELPDKIETLQTSELLPAQKKLYMAYLLQLQQETSQQLEAEGFQKSRMKILAGLTRLRQLCCHPSLFVDNYKDGSGKLEQLLELAGEYREAGRRMLIFSQFTSMLAIVREEAERRGWSYFYLDGSTKAAERVELCRRFNEGESELFLISLKAGGTGLNLTGADTVILYDLWWNPAVEQQAADRAHRIGQKNVVQVIRLMTEGTIEEKMYELQQRKKDLIDTVVQPGEEALSTLTEDDIRELLAL